MKKIFFVLLIIHCSIIISNAQWIQQNTGTTADLYNIKFINKYTGWVCGGGVILKTTNSGNNWLSLSLPVSKMLFEIHPVDSNVIYSVGMFETIIKSTNGGTNWQIIRNGTSGNTYYCCYFVNKNTGWISGGAEKKILKTTNGGLSFDSIVTSTSGFIQDIYFRDSSVGLYCDDNGAVRKSTNGGYNWFSVNIPVGSYIYDFQNFSFINNLTGWAVTYSRKIFKTTDFGNNWDSICTIQNSGIELYSIFFTNDNNGYSGGSGYYFYKSTNGGYNWIQQYLAYPLNGATSIYFINDTVGWKVANGGRICYTTNGGGITQITKNKEQIINDFKLYQNYPNPFNLTTTIEFEVNEAGYYRLDVFDLLGRERDNLFLKHLKPGKYQFIYNAENISSGTYFYRLQSDKNYRVKSFILIK
jgi:photosystem II stability/assembly factor-like uncharacterized protein